MDGHRILTDEEIAAEAYSRFPNPYDYSRRKEFENGARWAVKQLCAALSRAEQEGGR